MIREATAEDLPRLKDLAEEFCRTTKFLRGFDFDKFCASWKQLISGPGVIFLAESTRGLDGALGGVAFPDVNSGLLVCAEFFWMMRVGRRGGGLRLYSEFEKWARAQGCVEMRMVALADSMPEEVEKIYLRRGFERMEIQFSKPL